MVEITHSGAKEPKIMEQFSGGCQYGAVRFHVAGPLGKAGIYHCRMCQKAFGSWVRPWFQFQPETPHPDQYTEHWP